MNRKYAIGVDYGTQSGRAVLVDVSDVTVIAQSTKPYTHGVMEEYLPGRTENLHDYLIPTFGDVPPIDVYLIEDPEPTGPYGAKGIGEPALIPTPPAIFGAIHHATGVRMKQAPATPDRVRAAILAAQGEN